MRFTPASHPVDEASIDRFFRTALRSSGRARTPVLGIARTCGGSSVRPGPFAGAIDLDIGIIATLDLLGHPDRLPADVNDIYRRLRADGWPSTDARDAATRL